MGGMNPSTAALVSMAKPVTVSLSLSGDIEMEVEHNERVFAGLGLIGRFQEHWPSLGDLHKWISEHWEPIVAECVQIYPHARGFFVVVFQNEVDRNKILGRCQWFWEDSHSLLLKPWHLAFNPNSETFDSTPIWIRLPNLPLQFWFDSCFEAIGNSLGKFLMSDEVSLNLMHTTFARLLVEMDSSKDLPSEISISTSKGSWL